MIRKRKLEREKKMRDNRSEVPEGRKERKLKKNRNEMEEEKGIMVIER